MKKCLYWLGACALLASVACTKSSPSRPTETAAAEQGEAVTSVTANGVTITSPAAVTPAANANVRFADQPITLTVRNGVQTGASASTYTFQVARDAAFASIVATKDNVAEGASGQTSTTLDRLPGATTYYWRARMNAGSVNGPFGAGRAVNVGPEVVIQAPALVTPINGANFGGNAPLTVNNASRTGPAGGISYRFEVSDTNSFSNIVFVTTVNEGNNGQTSVTMNAKLVTNATYFWHVVAQDPSNGVASPFSSIATFKYVPFDMSQAVMQNTPPDLAVWPETAKITSVAFSPSWFQVEFDKRDGPGRWPDVTPAGWDGALQYTLGMCGNINGTWNCAGIVQFWHGRTLTDSAPPSHVGIEWFYGRWGALNGFQPQDGEQVGLFVASGNLRDGGFTRATCPAVCERSNVAMVTWTNFGNQTIVFP